MDTLDTVMGEYFQAMRVHDPQHYKAEIEHLRDIRRGQEPSLWQYAPVTGYFVARHAEHEGKPSIIHGSARPAAAYHIVAAGITAGALLLFGRVAWHRWQRQENS